jgi:hypothetical protein
VPGVVLDGEVAHLEQGRHEGMIGQLAGAACYPWRAMPPQVGPHRS